MGALRSLSCRAGCASRVSLLSFIDVEPIARALGRQRANALPTLNAFSGADTVEV